MYKRKPVIPHSLAINAMRETGYRNTTYAIAELIDNSIQANAKNIELLCYDRVDSTTGRKTIHQIAVVDDGDGMTEDVLEKSVQFGNGTRLKNRNGIGRFGMGLPNSSISQCKFAEIYTWQNQKSPLYSYVTVTERNGDNEYVPKPERKQFDKHWGQVSECIKNPTGTLVVWSELDKCNWRKSSTIIEKSELLIGRIYRNLIDRGDIVIRVVSFNENSIKPELDHTILVNDPCFLMAPSSTPEPYNDEPMFVQDGDVDTIKHTINNTEYAINIKYSVAKLEARQDKKGNESGNKEWGKRAAQNVGVSLMRANRELELDTSLVNTYDTRERWWGVEVAFDPHLDEIFGVTNTKQSARHFARLAKASRSIKLIGGEIEDDLNDDDKVLWEVITSIEGRLTSIRDQIKHQLENTRKRQRKRRGSEEKGTDATNDRKEEGYDGESDKGEKEPTEQRKQSLVKILVEDGSMSKEEAYDVAKYTVDNKLKYIITSTTLSGKMLFDVLSRNGVLIVKINRNHHAYENLMAVVQYKPKEESNEAVNDELQNRLRRASIGIELMLLAWARLEDEQRNDEKRQEMQELRMKWGGMLSKFLEMNT
ncbi:MAG: ATP-binding protein [Thaumarchaeota archaeon]|nr:ATP-binding protein [Nitrososphaerota archaeon]